MKKPQIVFITGTDTDAGKTVASLAVMESLARAGYSTTGLKPVAAGGVSSKQEVRNEDALQLQATATCQLSYEQVNPVALAEPIAPHIAAKHENIELSVYRCLELCQPALEAPVDCVVVEGAGGWRVPLNELENMSDLAVSMAAKVVLVVGMKLGCLNHAILTAEAIRADGLQLTGWIANDVSGEMPERKSNLATLQDRLQAPLLAELPYQSSPDPGIMARYVDTELILRQLQLSG